MIPKEAESTVYVYPEGFEEMDEDVVVVNNANEVQNDQEPDANAAEDVPSNEDVMQQFEEWHPTAYGGLFGDVIEVVIEEVPLDVGEINESLQLFEEDQVLNNVTTEEEENIKTKDNEVEDDVPVESVRESQDLSENHDLSGGFKLVLSDSDDNSDAKDPSEILIGDSPMIGRKSKSVKSKHSVEFLLIYPAPPLKGGISVNTEDYKCLGEDTYLNDVIIDFYMKYLLLEMLSPIDRQRTHIFSSHFFTRLARCQVAEDYDEDVSANKAKKMHAGVQRWTKNVNIFEKDFVVIPVNEYSHWFLVIICFANLVDTVGPQKNDCFISNQEVQRPCLLIFDSLGSRDKFRVANTLRSYLSIEYCTKMGQEKIFSTDSLKTTYVKVPRQTNATDCGLYVLQYVESFFENPIQNFMLPFKDLSDWFERSVIIRKREAIAELITELAIQFSDDKSVNLPEVKFPKLHEIISDNEDIFDSWGNSSESLENPYANVTKRKYEKTAFDTPPLFYKRNTTLHTIAKSSPPLKKNSWNLSDSETEELSFVEEDISNSTASTSKHSSVTDNEWIKPERPPRKVVTRTQRIMENAKSIKNRKRNEDLTFYKKFNVTDHSIESTASNSSQKRKAYGSSPWMSKDSGCSEKFFIDSGISSERFYGYSIKNTESPVKLKQQQQPPVQSSSKDMAPLNSIDLKYSDLPDDKKSSESIIYLKDLLRVMNPRVTPIKINRNKEQIRVMIAPDVGRNMVLVIELPENDDYTVDDILSTLKTKVKGEFGNTYLVANSVHAIDYVVKVFTESSCRKLNDDDNLVQQNCTMIDLSKDKTTEKFFSYCEKNKNYTKEFKLRDMQQLSLFLRRNIQIILMYPLPPRKQNITITVDDFKCLNKNEYLNDIIVDFYLKYLTLEKLPSADQERIYLFSTYFYTRLSRPVEQAMKGESLATLNYSVVKRWTKTINIFEKDFVIVPVHQNAHWFLVVICYPRLIGTSFQRSHSSFPNASQYPCILVFDSLPGLLSIKRSVIVQDLKNYLKCEYAAKMGSNAEYVEDDIVVFYPDVPNQLNSTDCGVYLLQYMENFCKDFIIPDKLKFDFVTLKNWFDKELIKSKRETLKRLIIRLAAVGSSEK